MNAPTCEIPGCRHLIERLDHAVARDDVADVTRAVQSTLEELISEGGVHLPADLRRPRAQSYARHRVHWSPELGYSVLAMVWSPGQGTPLHDHDGMWCVEGVYQGELAVTQYELLEHDDDADRWRFRREQRATAGVGSAGRLIPPFDYHTIDNYAGDVPAITLHVYGGRLMRCHVFEPEAEADGWYRCSTKVLQEN